MKVEITPQALADLAEIHAYIAGQDGFDRADKVLETLDAAIQRLDKFAERGLEPPELGGLGKGHRQVVHAPWRIIYLVQNATVTVTLVADGRRDLRSLLSRRLIRTRP